MTWRGATDIKDRIFGTLVYCFAFYDAAAFGQFLLQQFPVFNFLILPALPATFIYGLLGTVVGQFASFIVFLLLFMTVVRNDRISHFIRYNTMQSILIGIILALISLIVQYILLPAFGSSGLLIETLFNVAFLGGLAACYYSMIQSALGRYAEIPTISEAAYSQVRW